MPATKGLEQATKKPGKGIKEGFRGGFHGFMKKNGFSKKVRLVHRTEFQRVRSEGRSAIGKYFRMNVLQGNAEAYPRVGIITTRKFGNAVERNRFRRRFREIVRKDLFRIHPGTWLVGIARRDARSAQFSALRDEWLRLAHKLSIFRNHP